MDKGNSFVENLAVEDMGGTETMLGMEAADVVLMVRRYIDPAKMHLALYQMPLV